MAFLAENPRARRPVCSFRRRCGDTSPSPGPALPLVGLTGIRRLVCRPQCSSLVPCTTRPGPVSMPWRVLCDRPSAGIVRPQVHPSLTALPFRVPSHLVPPDAFRRRARCSGSRPSHDITGARPLTRGFPGLATFRPRAFAAPRRLSPLSGSGACFIPQPCPGPILSRGSYLRAATLPRREELPPCRCISRRSPHPKARRPRREGSASRPCSARRCVAPAR
jgi:hypothetical protein